MRTMVITMTVLLAACTSPPERALRKGNAQYRAGAYHEAAAAYGTGSDDARLLYNQGNAFHRAHAWNDAVDRLGAAAQVWDTTDLAPRAYYNLGHARAMQARWADSLSRRALEEANGLRIEGDDIANKVTVFLLRDSLRNTHRQLDQLIDSALTEGAKAYRQALRRDPTDEDARHNLAMVMRLIAARPKPGGQNGAEQNGDKELTLMAKRLIHQADSLVDLYRFNEAFQVLQDGLKQEPTLKNRQDYMDKLATVTKAAGEP